MKKIKNFEDACKKLNLDATTIIPDFSLFPELDRKAMIAHAKLIIINKAIVGDWLPNWSDWTQRKYYPWFVMGSPSGDSFSYYDFGNSNTRSFVGSRLCFETSEQAKYAGKIFEEIYKDYFVKE